MSIDISKLMNSFGTRKAESQDEKDLKRYNELQHKSETSPAGSLTEAEQKELDKLQNHLGKSGKIHGGGQRHRIFFIRHNSLQIMDN